MKSFNTTHFVRRSLPLAALFLLIEFFDELYFGMQGAVLPTLRLDLGLDYAQVGLLLGVPGIIGTAIEPVIMLLGDTRLRKKLIVAGGLVMAFTALFIAGGPQFGLLLAAFVITYPASGAFVTLSQATLIDQNQGRESQMMARWTLSGSIGNVVGPLLAAGIFALGFSWRAPYLVIAGFGVCLALLVIPIHFPPAKNPTAHPDQGIFIALKTLLGEVGIALRNMRLMRWYILLDLSDLLLDVFVSYSALYFADVIGLSPAQVGVMLGIMMAAGVLKNILLIPILEHFPGRRVVRISALFASLLYTAFLFSPWPQVKLMLAVAVHFSTFGWYEVLQGEAYAALPGRSGTVMAINSVMGVLGGVLVWLIGWAADYAGLQTAMWLLIAGPLSLLIFMPRFEK